MSNPTSGALGGRTTEKWKDIPRRHRGHGGQKYGTRRETQSSRLAGGGRSEKNSEKANTLWKGSVGKSSGKTDKRLNSKTFVYFFGIFFHCRPKARDDCAFADLSPCPLCLLGSFCRIFRIRQYDILSDPSRINESYHFGVVHPLWAPLLTTQNIIIRIRLCF